MAPLMAWIVPSKPIRSAYGPSSPNAVAVTSTMDGYRSCSTSQSIPIRRLVSMGRLATTMSAVARSASMISAASRRWACNVIERFPRLQTRYMAPEPSSATGAMYRSSPPPGRSTRITSAPRSASRAAHHGPATCLPKSRTRMPASTPASCDGVMVASGVNPATSLAVLEVARTTTSTRCQPRCVTASSVP